MIEVRSACFGYRRGGESRRVLEGVSFTLEPGELLCVLGANGVGKTTMFRTILGFLPLLEGEILLDGTPLERIPRRRLAELVAYVPQYHAPPFPYTVYDVVLMGRGAHISPVGTPGTQDEEITLQMLDRMGILPLKDRIYTEISGGERQLTLIARALNQQARYLFMDEPASGLDFGNQHRLLRVIRTLAEEGYGVCFTSHAPDHAFASESAVLALEGGTRWEKGPAAELITPDLMRRMYGLPAEIHTYPGKNGGERRQVCVDMEDL